MKEPPHFLTLREVLKAAKAETFRWTPSRKAVVVEAVRDGKLSRDDVETRFGVSAEEFGSWSGKIDKHGVAGLRQTRLQLYEPQRRKVKSRPAAGAGIEDWQERRALMRQRFG